MKSTSRLTLVVAMMLFGMAFALVGRAGAHVVQTRVGGTAVLILPAVVQPTTTQLEVASDASRPNFNRPNFNRPNFIRRDFDRPFFNRPDFDEPFFVRPFFNPFFVEEDFDD
jgi:hypothetical protein